MKMNYTESVSVQVRECTDENILAFSFHCYKSELTVVGKYVFIIGWILYLGTAALACGLTFADYLRRRSETRERKKRLEEILK